MKPLVRPSVFLLSLCLLASLATACLQDPERPRNVPGAPTVGYDEENMTRVSVLLTGSFDKSLSDIVEYGFEIAENNGESNLVSVSAKDENNGFTYRASMDPGAYYRIRSYISNGQGRLYSAEKKFRAPETSRATLSAVTVESDRLVAKVEDNGGRTLEQVGFICGDVADIKVLRNKERIEASTYNPADGTLSLPLSAFLFEPGSTYYFIAYAEDEKGAYGYSPVAVSLSVSEEDYVHFEDAVFGEYVIREYDKNRDGKISYAEIKTITAIDVLTDNISSVREIDLMPELTSLAVRGSAFGEGKLVSIDISKNSKLTTVNCDNNRLDSLDLSKAPFLDSLSFSGNGITELDVTTSPRLRVLSAAFNQLTALDITQNEAMAYLDCRSNRLTAIDISNNPVLRHLDVGGNPISSIDISMRTDLTEFNAVGTPSLSVIYVWLDFKEQEQKGYQKDGTARYVISPSAPIPIPDANFKAYLVEHFDLNGDKEISISEAEQITDIDVSTDAISSLQAVEYCYHLRSLRCAGSARNTGQLTSLDLSSNPELTSLDCSNNRLTIIEIEANPSLTTLRCSGNPLKNLDVSRSAALTALSCSDCGLSEVNVSENRNLSQLDCSGNPIQVLEIASIPELTSLRCGNTKMETLDVSANRKLTSLNCVDESLKEVYLYANQRIPDLTKSAQTALVYLIDALAIQPESLSLEVGGSSTLNLMIEPADAIDKTAVWRSSDEKVATVSKTGEVKALAAGSCTITATCWRKEATCSLTVASIPVSSVTLNHRTCEIQIGETFPLMATVLPANATEKTVTWTSDDESVAIVSADGDITAVSLGTCTITASAGDKQDACVVTVLPIPVSSIELDQTSATITVGATLSLTATVGPKDATDKTVTWMSSNPAVATVTDDGLVVAESVGTAIITATAGDQKATCRVSVQPISVTSITLEPTECSVLVGATLQLSATVLPENASSKNITWRSSDSRIATVSLSGIVTGVAVGSCQITAECGDKEAVCDVTVLPVSVTSIILSQRTGTIAVGATLSLRATVQPDNASDKSVVWSSSDETVATVSQSGVVRGVSVGSCTIYAESGEVFGSCAITVQSNIIEVSSVSLNKTSLSLTEGETETLTATVLPNNATDKSITWTSDDTSVATVSQEGLVTAAGAGTCVITATAGGVSASCAVSVNKASIPISGLSFGETDREVYIGENFSLIPTITPDNATDNELIWTSSNPAVATVSSEGAIAPIAVGEATITATAKSGITATFLCQVVSEAPYFPDANFRAYVYENFDTNGDGFLSRGEAKEVTIINVWNKQITSLIGVEFFDNLYSLSCSDNQITQLNLANNKTLGRLYCQDNLLTELDIQNNPSIYELYCQRNQLQAIDVSNAVNLGFFDCSSNKLTSLDVRQNPKLDFLDCSYNEIANLDLSQNTHLTNLRCQNNELSSLNLTNNSGLQWLKCCNNHLVDIDLTNVTLLIQLDCGYNKLMSLDISNNTLLNYLDCYGNQIEILNVSNNRDLGDLICYNNQLTDIDLSNNSKLRVLNCLGNSLNSLDVSKNTALVNLICGFNQLSNLDVSKNVTLQELRCQGNQMASLDVSNNTALHSLECRDNPLLTEIWLKEGQTISTFYYDTDIATIKYK